MVARTKKKRVRVNRSPLPVMVRRRVLKVADAIARSPEVKLRDTDAGLQVVGPVPIEGDLRVYRQTSWCDPVRRRGKTCGTAMCVAGWTTHLFRKTKAVKKLSLDNAAASLLGLGGYERVEMFYSHLNATKREAVKMLRHYEKTGEVRW